MKKRKTRKGAIGKIGEFGFIGKIRTLLKSNPPSVIQGLGDDAAIFKPSAGHELVFTTDMLVEGRHFDFRFITPWQLGAKTMAVNLSDCAAMGAKPTVAVLSIGVPSSFPVRDLEAFYDGLTGWGESYGARVVGGDTVGSEKFIVNLALIGEIEPGRALLRSGAKVGDSVLVTGTLGDSAAGLHTLRHPSGRGKEAIPLLIKRHLTPVPRFNVGRYLSTRKLATSAIDISDGLSSEINHLCRESGVGAEILEETIPLSIAMIHYCHENRLKPLDFALGGGEDYELLFTVKSSRAEQISHELSAETGTPVHVIGKMVSPAKGVRLVTRKGKRTALKPGGYDHFSGLKNTQNIFKP